MASLGGIQLLPTALATCLLDAVLGPGAQLGQPPHGMVVAGTVERQLARPRAKKCQAQIPLWVRRFRKKTQGGSVLSAVSGGRSRQP